jgi:transposase-like protein
MEPQTLIEAVLHFSDLTVCFKYMVALKWPDGRIICPKCGGDKIGNVVTRCMLQCKDKECRKQFSVKVGTIFKDSPLGLDKWFVAVWAIANAKNGISSCELARAMGVRQPTAWFMLHRIRHAMQTPTFRKMTGLKGTYVAVAPFHLCRYVDEEAFRFNERKDNDGGRFAKVMRGLPVLADRSEVGICEDKLTTETLLSNWT